MANTLLNTLVYPPPSLTLLLSYIQRVGCVAHVPTGVLIAAAPVRYSIVPRDPGVLHTTLAAVRAGDSRLIVLLHVDIDARGRPVGAVTVSGCHYLEAAITNR
jgi:hypothetical protein